MLRPIIALSLRTFPSRIVRSGVLIPYSSTAATTLLHVVGTSMQGDHLNNNTTASSTTKMPGYAVQEHGGLHHDDYRLFLTSGNTPVSPFHDVPLYVDEKGYPLERPGKGIYNMVVEIPRWTNAKMEINTKEPLNPIKQDVKKGKPRFVCNVFPTRAIFGITELFHRFKRRVNCGYTWEDPAFIDEDTKCKGDSDPVDVCEIGHRVANRGEVMQVKVLGVIALIDEGETDWKVIAINIHDPLADKMNDIADVEKEMPGFMQNTIDWFRCYKIPDGKPENKFAFNGLAKGKDKAVQVIEETHDHWKHLIEHKNDRGYACANTTLKTSPYTISSSDAAAILSKQAKFRKTEPVDPSIDTWHFVARSTNAGNNGI